MTGSGKLLIGCRYEKANVASVASRGGVATGIKLGGDTLGGIDFGRVNLDGFTKKRGKCYAK
jgi:hypothetical protein